MRAPDFFVVGAPKCGTTAMHAYLRRHPRVFMPALKELHYYGSDLGGLSSTLTPGQHDALFEGAGDAGRVGETCIWALYSTEAAREIKAAHPSAGVVIMLRNPVDVMYALHSEYLFQAIEDIASFPRSLAAEAERRQGRRLPCGDLYPASIYLYREVVAFSGQVERYLEAFGADNVHVILYDDLKRDTASVYRGLLTFLGVDPSFAPGFEVINTNKRIRSRAVQQWLYNPSAPARRLIRQLVPSPTARRWMADRAARWNVTHAPRRPLPPRLRRRLQAECAPEVGRLGRSIGRDLTRLWSG